jgi:hypothetical protein
LEEGISAFAGGAYERPRLAINERFLNSDIAGLLQLGQMGAEIAVGDLEQIPQVGELELLVGIEGDQGRYVWSRMG